VAQTHTWQCDSGMTWQVAQAHAWQCDSGMMWQVAQTLTWQCDSGMMWQVEQTYNVTVWQWNDVTDNTDLPCDSVIVEWRDRWHRLTHDSVTVEWCDRWNRLTMWQCDSGMTWQMAQTYNVTVWQRNDVTGGTDSHVTDVTVPWPLQYPPPH